MQPGPHMCKPLHQLNVCVWGGGMLMFKRRSQKLVMILSAVLAGYENKTKHC